MKRIAIFNDFQLPLPAVRGGSVPTLTNFILDENEIQEKYKIDVFSCYDENAFIESKKYKNTHFVYSKQADKIRFFTNLKFVLKTKLHIPFDLSSVDLPRDVKKYFESQDYDVVYINGYIRGALPIIELAKKKDAKTIVHHHVVTDILNEKTIHGVDIVDKCDRMLFVSEFAANYARVGTAEQNSKMRVFLNAIDTNKFQFEDVCAVRREIRKKHGIDEQDTVVLFVGRMVENKGAFELIRGFNDANLGEHVKLMIVGGATYSSKKVTPYVQTCFDEARKNQNILFTGYVSYNDIPKYYAASDISTLISRYNEACGLVGIESMASGLPVITTNRGGIGEYVCNDCKIVTLDDDNLVESIVSAIKALVGNNVMRSQMSVAGIECSRNYNKAEYFQRFSEIIDNI